MLNMSTSFKSYGKIAEADQAKLDARRKTRRRLIIIALSSLVLVSVIVAAVVGSTQSKKSNKNGGNSNSLSSSVKVACDQTLYKDTCFTSLESRLNDSSQELKPQDILKLSLQVAHDELSKASDHFSDHGSFQFNSTTDKMANLALSDCRELLSLALDHLSDTMDSGDLEAILDSGDDLRTWLSTTGTCQQTCIDGLEEVRPELKDDAHKYLKNSGELTSNSLAILSWISKVAETFKLNKRRLLSTNVVVREGDQLPEWVSRKERLLLVQASDLRKKANIVVAKDGTGKYKTITAALKAVPEKSKKRFVIYVKKGVYFENVRIEKPMWNVTIVGDGMEATIVSGSLNVVDGTPTFSSASFAVFGKGFMAREMGFRNTAGPAKHQAVALMSTADMSVFYRCRIDAFQDTLYAHSNRQFYRECNIYGTVDFIFGNSAVVIQNCNILPRVPMQGQQNTVTAQGKADPNQNTGISIQNCTIWPYGNLSNVQTYLGRPWKNYSTTVYMHSLMGGLINPSGWLPWVGDSAPSTIYYAEYQNFGPGSNTKNRVKWKGLRAITSKDANKFTVKAFLQGDKWISGAGVSYKPGL